MSDSRLDERFATAGPSRHWQRMMVGDALLETTDQGLRLINEPTKRERYTNAQIDDYQGLPRRRLPWFPPLVLTVRARFSHPGAMPQQSTGNHEPGPGDNSLSGTAGFGFWNDPFFIGGRRLPTLPKAIWFFYASPPSNMKLDLTTPGWGWKAATIDAARLPFLLLAPTAPIAMPLMNINSLYHRLWPIGQQAIRVSEAMVDVKMTGWHTYVIDWTRKQARFLVDEQVVLDCDTPPRGPLGLVIWLDNQYLALTPQGRFSWGLLACGQRQWLELAQVVIDR